jgi:hypothetical protein
LAESGKGETRRIARTPGFLRLPLLLLNQLLFDFDSLFKLFRSSGSACRMQRFGAATVRRLGLAPLAFEKETLTGSILLSNRTFVLSRLIFRRGAISNFAISL